MSRILKPFADPPGTIFKGNLEIADELIFVDAHIQGDNIVILMQGLRLGCKKEMLLKYSLLEIIDRIFKEFVTQQQEPELEADNINNNEMPVAQEEVDA